MDLDLFDYDLPQEMIAQSKSYPRDMSRLFHLDARGAVSRYRHMRFKDIVEKLDPGDILILNRSRVIPARIRTRKPTGGRSEVLLLGRSGRFDWEALVGGKRIEEGMVLLTKVGDMRISVERRLEEGRCMVCFYRDGEKVPHHEVLEWLSEFGLMPTPPYIKRMLSDPEEYQTVYGNIEGSVAAPTAGLHFTDELLESIRKKGVEVLFVVLHVGLGTFAPVKSANIKDHVMEEEEYLVPPEVAEKIREAISDHDKGKKRIWAVGTTVMRTLESAFDGNGNLVKSSGRTGLYITPGYQFKIPYKGFITNFHLPRSTPLILVSAFHNREGILDAYEEAKRVGYRFYSLGDSMMIRKG